MDAQTALNILGGIVAAVFGWFARTLYSAVEQLRRDLSHSHMELRRDLSELHVEVARDYVPTKRFEEAVGAIAEKLDRILDKLDSKADKA